MNNVVLFFGWKGIFEKSYTWHQDLLCYLLYLRMFICAGIGKSNCFYFIKKVELINLKIKGT